MDETIHFDRLDEMMYYQRRRLAEAAYNLVEAVFAQPGAEEEYKAFLEKRYGKKPD